MIGFYITPSFFMVLARFLTGLSTLGAMMRQDLYLLRLRAEKIGVSITGILCRHGNGEAMALGTANIHLTDLKRKVEGGFGLRNNGLSDSLVSSIFSTAILLDLGTDREP